MPGLSEKGQLRSATKASSMWNLHEGELQLLEQCPALAETQPLFVEWMNESTVSREILLNRNHPVSDS